MGKWVLYKKINKEIESLTDDCSIMLIICYFCFPFSCMGMGYWDLQLKDSKALIIGIRGKAEMRVLHEFFG